MVKTNPELTKFTIDEILNELLYREKHDSTFELIKETPTSYTFKFFKYN